MIKSKERRKRLKRPNTLLIFGILFILLPVFNYVTFAIQSITPIYYPLKFLKAMNPIGAILWFFPIIVGIGLLMVKKWGWYLFLIYAPVFIVYNLIIIIRTPELYNFATPLSAILGFGAIFYFIRKDIASPFMDLHPRGWRLQKRIPKEINITIDGINQRTKDICERGLFALWPDCPKEINSEVSVSFNVNGEVFDFKGGIVRLNEQGAGIAFRYLAKSDAIVLEKALA